MNVHARIWTAVVLLGSIGVAWSAPILEAGVQIPVVQNLNGTALKNDWILNAGFRINF